MNDDDLKAKISGHPFFQGMKREHLSIVSEGATEVTFHAGERIFREGEPASTFYLIETGQVLLEAHAPADGTVPVQTLRAGEVLGWSWLFPPFTWLFQARATEPTAAVALNGGHLLMASERDHEFGYELMKRFAKVLIHRLQATRQQLLTLQVESAMEG